MTNKTKKKKILAIPAQVVDITDENEKIERMEEETKALSKAYAESKNEYQAYIAGKDMQDAYQAEASLIEQKRDFYRRNSEFPAIDEFIDEIHMMKSRLTYAENRSEKYDELKKDFDHLFNMRLKDQEENTANLLKIALKHAEIEGENVRLRIENEQLKVQVNKLELERGLTDKEYTSELLNNLKSQLENPCLEIKLDD